MIRIAILFSGRMDNTRTLYTSLLNNIIQSNQVDFFISHSPTDKNTIQEFRDLYKPKKMCQYKGSYHLDPRIPTSARFKPHNLIQMWKNRLLVYNLFKSYSEENDINYDLIISTRTDLLYTGKINIPNIIKQVNNNELCIPSGQDWGGINDQIAIGNDNTISVYLGVYNLLPILMKSHLFHPEVLLKIYLIRKRIKIYRFGLDYSINRSKLPDALSYMSLTGGAIKHLNL